LQTALLHGRLDTITTSQGKKFAYTYNKGQLQSLVYPNAISAYYSFDNNGNLVDLHYQRSDMSSVQRLHYAYDTNNMRKSMTDNDGVHDYTYDSLYQIIGATHPNAQRPLEAFEYDAVGNWLGGGRVHNELNQLTEYNFYSYVTNNALNKKDPFGLWGVGRPADPTFNTITCDGKGGIQVQLV
jgi:YD repeat-containing protein